jgi:hypothetical protein
MLKTKTLLLYNYEIYLWLYSPCGSWPLFQFPNLYTIGRIPWTGDQPVARPLPTHRTTQTHNKRTQPSMPRVRFEPTIPVFERAKSVHALDRTATVTGIIMKYSWLIFIVLKNVCSWRLVKNASWYLAFVSVVLVLLIDVRLFVSSVLSFCLDYVTALTIVEDVQRRTGQWFIWNN